MNKQAEPLLRHRREELMGKSLWEVFPEAVGTIFYEEYHRALAQQVTVGFEAFYSPFNTWFEVRAYPTSAGKIPGVGLYIAKGLVEAHGGRVWARSEPGKYVTFRFVLPA